MTDDLAVQDRIAYAMRDRIRAYFSPLFDSYTNAGIALDSITDSIRKQTVFAENKPTPTADYVERTWRAGMPLLPGIYDVERTIILDGGVQILIGGGRIEAP